MQLKIQEYVKNWSNVLKWIFDEDVPNEKLIINKILEFNSLNDQKQPRINCCLSVLQDVEHHAKESKCLDLSTFKLYASALKVPNVAVISFLESVYDGSVEALYYSIPPHIFSRMEGRPSKTRDLNAFDFLSMPRRIEKRLGKHPALLLSTQLGLELTIGERKVDCIEGLRGLVVAIPSSSRLEQYAIVCDPMSGKANLVSTTRLDIQVLGSFELEIPDDQASKIDWIDVIVWENSEMVLYWGGTDALRGNMTWNFCSGLNISEINNLDEFFLEPNVPDDVIEKIREKCTKSTVDFLQHGNVLTSWTQLIDTEDNSVRKWIPKTKITMDSWCIADLDQEARVWGVPSQFYSIVNTTCSLIELGVKRNSFKVPDCDNFCVLYSHCTK